jgi:hypothetical protein
VVSFTLLPLYSRGKSPGTHWIGGRVGPRVSLDVAEKRKILHCRKSNPGHLSIYYSDNITFRITALERYAETYMKLLLNYHLLTENQLNPMFVS